MSKLEEHREGWGPSDGSAPVSTEAPSAEALPGIDKALAAVLNRIEHRFTRPYEDVVTLKALAGYDIIRAHLAAKDAEIERLKGANAVKQRWAEAAIETREKSVFDGMCASDYSGDTLNEVLDALPEPPATGPPHHQGEAP